MKLDDYRKKLEQDSEYQAAKEELQPLFDLGNEVLRHRLRMGWTQTELAERVGTKQANISKIESGLGNPTYKFLVKLVKVFDADLFIRFQSNTEGTKHEAFSTQPDVTHREESIIVHNWPALETKQTRWNDRSIDAERERIQIS